MSDLSKFHVEGWLKKKKTNKRFKFTSDYVSRYFKLDGKDQTLSYANSESKKATKSIPFKDIIKFQVALDQGYELDVATKTRNYVLFAPDERQFLRWKEAFRILMLYRVESTLKVDTKSATEQPIKGDVIAKDSIDKILTVDSKLPITEAPVVQPTHTTTTSKKVNPAVYKLKIDQGVVRSEYTSDSNSDSD